MTGLTDFILDNEIRKDLNLFAQNREGICQLAGFSALFLFGAGIGLSFDNAKVTAPTHDANGENLSSEQRKFAVLHAGAKTEKNIFVFLLKLLMVLTAFATLTCWGDLNSLFHGSYIFDF